VYSALYWKGFFIKNLRVICIGNRFAYPDNFGILVYEKLKTLNLECEIIEGGVGGLSLLSYFEDNKKVLIIDYAVNMPKIITKEEIKKIEIDEFSHANAFLYLLKIVENEYFIYSCNEKFDENKIDKYIDEILKVINDYTRYVNR